MVVIIFINPLRKRKDTVIKQTLHFLSKYVKAPYILVVSLGQADQQCVSKKRFVKKKVHLSVCLSIEKIYLEQGDLGHEEISQNNQH